MEQSSSFAQHHLFLAIRKPSTMSKRAQERMTEEVTCGVKIETGMFGFKKPERKANLLFGFGCFIRPGESRVGSEFCFHEHMKFKVFASPV